MFEYDYCFCANETCPKRNGCRRGLSVPGIHTYALFNMDDNENCEYFWKREEKNEKQSMGN